MEVFGLDVTNTTPGGLKAGVGAQADAVTSLKVSGVLNAADFEFICHDMPALQTLDLSDATVAAYSGAKLLNGRYTSAAHVLPEYAMINSGVTSVVLPSTLTTIGESAFAASKIKNITIPATVTSIGESAFAGCADLTSVTIPASVTTIGRGAFNKCTALTSASINGNVTEIPARAFAGCTSLAAVTVPSTLRTIGEEAFALTAVKSLALAECTSLTSVGKWAFAGCDKLVAVVMPSPVPELAEGAFFRNPELKADVTALQGDHAAIADYAFSGNGNMTINDFEQSSVSSIGKYALQGLSGVSVVNLPPTLDSLGDHAMANMSGLTKIMADGLASVPAVGEDVWDGVAQGDVTLGVTQNMADAFRNADQWQNFAIEVVTTGLDEITGDDDAGSGVSGRFAGSELIVSSLDSDILGVQLYDVAGRMYAMPAATPSTLMTLDASAVEDGIYVVRVLLADGNVAALKLRK